MENASQNHVDAPELQGMEGRVFQAAKIWCFAPETARKSGRHDTWDIAFLSISFCQLGRVEKGINVDK